MIAKKEIKLILIFYALSILAFLFFGNEIIRLDNQIFLQINQVNNPALDYFFIIVTMGGSTLFWLLLISVFWMGKQRKISILLLIVFLIDNMTVFGSKLLFNRSRPNEIFSGIKVLDDEIGQGFPSGHSERAFSGATILGSFYGNLKYFLYF